MHCSSFDPVFVTHLTNIARMFSPIWSFRVCLCVCLSMCLFLQQKTARLLLQKKTSHGDGHGSNDYWTCSSWSHSIWHNGVITSSPNEMTSSWNLAKSRETARPHPPSLAASSPPLPPTQAKICVTKWGSASVLQGDVTLASESMRAGTS